MADAASVGAATDVQSGGAQSDAVSATIPSPRLAENSEEGQEKAPSEEPVTAVAGLSRKRRRLDPSADDSKTTESADVSEPASPVDSEGQQAIEQVEAAKAINWNKGAVGELRTSFGTRPNGSAVKSRTLFALPVQPINAAASRSSTSLEEASGGETRMQISSTISKEGMKSPVNDSGLGDAEMEGTLRHQPALKSLPPDDIGGIYHDPSGVDWDLPKLQELVGEQMSAFTSTKMSKSVVKAWAAEFIKMNQRKLDAMVDHIVAAAFLHAIQHTLEAEHLEFKRAVKSISKLQGGGTLRELIDLAKARQSGRRTTPSYVSTTGPQITRSDPASTEVATMSTSHAGNAVFGHDSEQDEHSSRNSRAEAEYMQRYFPAQDVETFCSVCARSGHRHSSCPELTCKFCGDQRHISTSCPTRTRCENCRQLGHVASACSSKLKLAPGEDDECAFCGSAEHHDDQCEEIWRSFDPEDHPIKKVKDIPVYCCNCGFAGHYGPECGLLQNANFDHATWSTSERDRYVDAASTAFAISRDPANALPPGKTGNERPDLGRSIKPQTHIYFPDSDSGGEEFKPRAREAPQRLGAGIRINTTGSMGIRINGLARSENMAPRGNGRGRSNRGPQSFVPPLPPGPPPPGPPQGDYRADLPARPPPPQNSYRPASGAYPRGGGPGSGGAGGAGGFTALSNRVNAPRGLPSAAGRGGGSDRGARPRRLGFRGRGRGRGRGA
jgi:hypothetical protein